MKLVFKGSQFRPVAVVSVRDERLFVPSMLTVN